MPMARVNLQIRWISSWGYPNSLMLDFMENPTKIRMIGGYPYFRKPPYINMFMNTFPIKQLTDWNKCNQLAKKTQKAMSID